MATNPRQFAGQDSSQSQQGSTVTTTQNPVFEAGTETINQQNMTPQSLASLEALISMLQGGGTLQQKTEVARKKQTQDLIQAMLGQFSTGQAFTDAQGLMALNLQKAMETNRPAIQRAVEGAGTSASSMQGLLSQNLSRDAALAASALGAEQAAKYGGITSALTGQLGQMASTAMDPAGQQLIEALRIAQGAVQTAQKTSTGNKSGGGSTVMSAPTGGVGNTSFSAPQFTSWKGTEAVNVMDNPNAFAPANVGQYGQSRGQSLADFLRSM